MRAWSGAWVADRLGVALSDGARRVEATLPELVGLAVRRNPRRAHLLVSTVLGKHVPTDPRLVYASGLLLGELVRGELLGTAVDVQTAGALLRGALAGRPGAAAGLRDLMREPREPVRAVVLGYAETATALGHAVADALGDAVYLHSTRRPVEGIAPAGGFEEEHSHATSHLLLPVPADLLDTAGPVVLVDDEMSTGTTARNTLRALHAVRPRDHYVVAALVDLRDGRERAAMAALAAELGTRIDVVALATGTVLLPEGLLRAGQDLVAGLQTEVLDAGPAQVRRVDLDWPRGLPDGGRHGFGPEDRTLLEKELPALAAAIARQVPDGAARVLVLGFEELMYVPLRLAEALADQAEFEVRYSTTTRSPVLAVDDPGYAIRTRLAFPAHDNPADGPGVRYAYNVLPGRGQEPFDAIVLVVDDVADTPELHHGLLGRIGTTVLLAVIPSHRPPTEENV
ncbi:MAG: phosphoribosyltransferase family protein [Streptosporangiaceae bacterium]